MEYIAAGFILVGGLGTVLGLLLRAWDLVRGPRPPHFHRYPKRTVKFLRAIGLLK